LHDCCFVLAKSKLQTIETEKYGNLF